MTTVANKYATRKRFERPSARTAAEGRAPVVLMVSGGADSTALLLLAATSELDIDDGNGLSRIARERLHVLHVNHQLRGQDAIEDEEFVCELAATYGIPCTVRRVDVAALAARPGADGNVENVGREVRYAAANELANTLSKEAGTPRAAARIVTAHTADDRAETFLMNAIRGSATAGLSSIPWRRNRVVRPLLDRTHEELCELLRMNGIVWHEDATNADTRYLRSFVRHELLPVARDRNPRVVANISQACDILSDEDAFLTSIAARARRELTRRSSDTLIALDARRLSATDVAIARRVVRASILEVCPQARLEARHIASVLRIVSAGEGSVNVPMGVDCRVEYGLLFVRARSRGDGIVPGWLEAPGTMDLGQGRSLVAELVRVPAGADPVQLARTHGLEWDRMSVLLDARACGVNAKGDRLWVDAPQPGELVCPLGMHGQSKKLSDLLAEAHVPSRERADVPIVHVSSTGPVVWVAGVRADERARCVPQTDMLLKLTLREANSTSVAVRGAQS